MEYRALRCRALWVLSVNDLPQDLLCDVVDLAARNLQHTDVVVALQAVSTLTGLMKAIVAHLQVRQISVIKVRSLAALLGCRTLFVPYEPLTSIQHTDATLSIYLKLLGKFIGSH